MVRSSRYTWCDHHGRPRIVILVQSNTLASAAASRHWLTMQRRCQGIVPPLECQYCTYCKLWQCSKQARSPHFAKPYFHLRTLSRKLESLLCICRVSLLRSQSSTLALRISFYIASLWIVTVAPTRYHFRRKFVSTSTSMYPCALHIWILSSIDTHFYMETSLSSLASMSLRSCVLFIYTVPSWTLHSVRLALNI